MTDLVIGNGTIDCPLEENVRVTYEKLLGRKYKVTLSRGKNKLEIYGSDGPIKGGGKYTSTTVFHIDAEESGFLSKERRPGGGGVNSLKEISRLLDETKGIKFSSFVDYFDLGIPSLFFEGDGRKFLNKILENEYVRTYFQSRRPLPINILLSNDRKDKVIIKSPIEEVKIYDGNIRTLDDRLEEADSIFMNSVKEEEIARHVVEKARSSNGKKLYSVITKSLDPNFVQKEIIPYGVDIFNYDEFGYVMGYQTNERDEKERIDIAIENIRKIRTQGLNTRYNIFVTCGENGVLTADQDSIYHIRLKDDVLKKVNDVIERKKGATTGAGDVFAGAVFFYEKFLKEKNIQTLAKKACIRAVKYLGYDKVSLDDFVVTEYKIFDRKIVPYSLPVTYAQPASVTPWKTTRKKR